MKNNSQYKEKAFSEEIDLFQIVSVESMGPLIPTIKDFLPGVRSVLISGLSYYCSPPDSSPCPTNPFYSTERESNHPLGSIAPYTRANFYKIHYKAIRRFLQKMDLVNKEFRISVNSKLPEKAIGAHTGFALPGRHSILMSNELGTTFVLGITAIARELPSTEMIIFKNGEERPPLTESLCTDCRRCEKACPTSAINNKNVDRANCIQGLSSDGGIIPVQIMNNWGTRFFGCSICQDVCPINKSKLIKIRDLPETGRVADNVSLFKVLKTKAEEVRNSFKGNQVGAQWVSSAALHRNALLALIHSVKGLDKEDDNRIMATKLLREFSHANEPSLIAVADYGISKK